MPKRKKAEVTKKEIESSEHSPLESNEKLKKPRKKAEKKPVRPLPPDKWWLNFNEDGTAVCMVFTTNVSKEVKLKDVKCVVEYATQLFGQPYAIQYEVSYDSPSFYDLLEMFDLSESDRDEQSEIPIKRKRKKETD